MASTEILVRRLPLGSAVDTVMFLAIWKLVGGSRVDATVAGLPLEFTASFEAEVASGFLGTSLSRTSTDGSGFFSAAAEAHLVTDGSYEFRGNLTAGLTF